MTSTVTHWWWVRHAPVTVNEGRIYGRGDLPCDTDDTEIFDGLAKLLPEDALLVTSDLMRTHQTADAIAAAGLTFPPRREEPDIAEQSFGDWQGQHYADVEKTDPHILHDYWLCPAHYRPPNGESFADLIARVAPVIERVSDENPGRDIVAVAHGGTIRAALAIALGLDPERALSFSVENLSVTRIDRIETGSDAATPGLARLSWRTVMVNRMPGLRRPGGRPIR